MSDIMRILIDIGHPAQVHFCKNIIQNLEKHGHEVKITARDKDLTQRLLDIYGFEYENLGKIQKGLFNKAIEMIKIDYRLYKIAKKFKPDLLISKSSIYAAHVSNIIHKPYILVHDTEHAMLANWLTFPFTDVICTPKSCKSDINPKKHVIFDSYKELAYLHPNYFKPDSSVLDDLELGKDDKFIIMRFVSWGASHDVGQCGVDFEAKKRLIKELEKYGKVFITSEAKIEKEFEKYKLNMPPEKIHDLLFYATLYVGEGATMASEAGILGTPSIYISSLFGTMGNFDDLEKNYGLVYTFQDSTLALEKALELLDNKDIKEKWQKKREKLLNEKIDVTAWMTEFIENYPESFYKYKNADKGMRK